MFNLNTCMTHKVILFKQNLSSSDCKTNVCHIYETKSYFNASIIVSVHLKKNCKVIDLSIRLKKCEKWY